MIELEIQGLSGNREGLLIEIGRLVVAHEFTLQRQRLVQDPHGILLTMVVRGLSRRKRALEEALDGCERFISVKVFPFVESDPMPHFAASRKRAESVIVAPPTPAEPSAATAPVAEPMAITAKTEPEPVTASTMPVASESWQEPSPEPEFEFILPTPRASAAVPVAPVDTAPFVDLIPLEPDGVAVEKALRELEYDYPRIVPQLLALERSVAAGARESSLALAGRRTGAWVFERDYAEDGGLDLHDAIERIGAPALRALVEVDQQGGQLHIHDSPLCAEGGHSGCSFFSGFLEGLLGPATASGELSIFPVCCRSYGADECVLAISD